jgi:pimeloyl-ACP methyl ester carboxylesterase
LWDGPDRGYHAPQMLGCGDAILGGGGKPAQKGWTMMGQVTRFACAGLVLALVLAVGCGDNASVAPGEDGGARDSAPPQQDAAPLVFDWASCTLIEGADDGLAECATVQLPLDNDDPAGDTVGIFVKRVRGATQPARGQMWWVSGGPGGAATYEWGLSMKLTAAVMPDLDLYVADHRGTGRSERLACPLQERIGLATPEDFAGCLQEMQQAGFGPKLPFFTTTESARDLGRIIDATRAPGQQVFLYGGSYGTYHVLRYLQVYPDQPSGVILDGIAPPGFRFSDFSTGMDTVGKAALARCGADAYCSSKLGTDPAAVLADLESRIGTGPMSHCRNLGANATWVKANVGALLYWRPYLEYVPALIYRLQRCSNEDIQALVSFFTIYQQMHSAPVESFSAVLFYHVAGSEMWPSPSPSVEEMQARLEPLLMATVGVELAAAVSVWPLYDPAPYGGKWPQTSVPMIMSNGTLDVATPLVGARQAEAHFQGPHQTFLEFPDTGHCVGGQTPMDAARTTDCASTIAMQFIADPTATLDTSCMDDVLPLNFQGTEADNVTFWGIKDAWDGFEKPSLRPEEAARIEARRAVIGARMRGAGMPRVALPQVAPPPPGP